MKRLFLYVTAVALLMAACTKELHVKNVTIKPSEASLLVGHTLVLDATVEPAEAPNKNVTWSTDNDLVATVNSEGELTAMAPGTAKITVTTDDGGFKATCTVTVEKENSLVTVTGVTINCPEEILTVGKSLTLEAAVEPAEADNKNITWSSDNDLAVTVNTEGEITAIAPGTAKIIVTTEDGGFKATCTITVEENPEEPPIHVTGVITMTTQSSDVSIWFGITSLSGNHNVVIDWGDGEESIMYEFALPGSINFEHHYSGAFEHHIKITGNNIDRLDCSQMKLTALDVSLYPELKKLVCWYNNLTTLDMSKNYALELLWCQNNQLTNLDVSQNIALMSLFCENNPFTNFDVSKNTELYNLSFGGNQLTSLDVSKNALLTWLCVGDFPLNNLDVSKNTALIALYCYNTQITSLDVSNNTELLYLSCAWSQLTASALNDMFRTLPYVPEEKFAQINISGNPGQNDCDRRIAEEKGWLLWLRRPWSLESPSVMYLNFLNNNK